MAQAPGLTGRSPRRARRRRQRSPGPPARRPGPCRLACAPGSTAPGPGAARAAAPQLGCTAAREGLQVSLQKACGSVFTLTHAGAGSVEKGLEAGCQVGLVPDTCRPGLRLRPHLQGLPQVALPPRVLKLRQWE